MQYNNLPAGRGEQEEDASGNDFKSKLYVVPNDLIKLQIVIFAMYTGGAKDNGSNSDHGYSGNTAGLYWTSAAVFVDTDYEL